MAAPAPEKVWEHRDVRELVRSGAVVVVLDGTAYDVTAFVGQHPGGRRVIEQRNGTDATAAFHSVGHSSVALGKLAEMRLGPYCAPPSDAAVAPSAEDEESARLLSEESPESHGLTQPNLAMSALGDPGQRRTTNVTSDAAQWHAERRRAMLVQHPELADLMGHFPATLAIGLCASFTLLYVSLWARDMPAVGVLLAAYTVGAVCKMIQFAVAHEITHGLVHPKLDEKWWYKDVALRLCTLPSVANVIFDYYHNQHLAHHRYLGSQDMNTAAAGIFNGTQAGDGDQLSANNLLMKQLISESATQRRFMSLSLYDLVAESKATNPAAQWILKQGQARPWALKLVWDPLFHAGYFAVLLFASLVNVFFAVAFLSCKIGTSPRYIDRVIHVMKTVYKKDVSAHFLRSAVASLWPQAAAGFQFMLWSALLLLMYALPLGGSFWSQFVFLLLSDLFVFGFAFHPFLAYFITVHQSTKSVVDGVHGRCQPTMSLYSPVFSLLTLNLTYHVEHHDFPSVPWVHLPKVRATAPTFYTKLHSHPSVRVALEQYLRDPWTYVYGCADSEPSADP